MVGRTENMKDLKYGQKVWAIIYRTDEYYCPRFGIVSGVLGDMNWACEYKVKIKENKDAYDERFEDCDLFPYTKAGKQQAILRVIKLYQDTQTRIQTKILNVIQKEF